MPGRTKHLIRPWLESNGTSQLIKFKRQESRIVGKAKIISFRYVLFRYILAHVLSIQWDYVFVGINRSRCILDVGVVGAETHPGRIHSAEEMHSEKSVWGVIH